VAWQVTVKVPDARAQAAALQSLQGEGFQIIGQNDGTTAADRVYTLADADYSIRLAYTTVGTSPAVSYGVAPRDTTP
jgi:hypothetical protein